MDRDYHKLEFEVSAEPGREDRDSFFGWAKSVPDALRFVEGTEQIRMRSRSGHQVLLFRADAEHEGGPGWHNSSIDRDILLRAHIANPGHSWSVGTGPDIQRATVRNLDMLQVVFIEGVGWMLELPETEDTVAFYPLTQRLAGEVHAAIEGIDSFTRWEQQAPLEDK